MYKNVVPMTPMHYLSQLQGTLAYHSQPQKLAQDQCVRSYTSDPEVPESVPVSLITGTPAINLSVNLHYQCFKFQS